MDISAVPTGADKALAVPKIEEGFEAPLRPLPRPPRNGLSPSLERRRLQIYLGLILADITLLLGSFSVLSFVYEPARSDADAMLAAYLLLPIFLTIALYNGTYSRDGLTRWRSASGRAIVALLVSAALLNFLAFFAKTNAEFSRVVFSVGLICTGLGMIVVRVALARRIVTYWGPSAINRLVIEAGGPPVAIPHIYRVNAAECGLRPDIEDPASLDRLSRYMRNMDQVIVSSGLEDRTAWAEVLKGSGIHGEVVSEYAREIGALSIVHHDESNLSGLLVSAGQLGMRARITKRLFDIGASLAGLIVLSPLLLLSALAIKIEDRGPVFFLQRRMGRGNTFFDIVKFRSMSEAKEDGQGTRSASKDDDRITRVGKLLRRTSLDELPQLINVLKGDMSIVGPRPHALGSLAGEKTFWQVDRKYWQRHCLRPGITGLAQIRGFRGATDTERDLVDRLRSDMEYMNRWSLWQDVKIVFATLRVLVHHRAF